MFTKIRKWLFQRYYARTHEKEAWAYQLEAELLREGLSGDKAFYDASVKATEEKIKKVEELKAKLTELQGEAYNENREEIDILNKEIASAQERDKDFQEKLMPQARSQIISKQQTANHSLYKAKIFRKVKI